MCITHDKLLNLFIYFFQLKEPIHSILTISESLNDDKATSLIRDVLHELTEGDGRVGMKMLLKFS